MNHQHKQPAGFIALVALLVLAAAGLAIGISISLVGLNELQASLADSQAVEAKALAQTCVEDGLERLRANFTPYSGSLSVGSGSCIIEIVVTGSAAVIHATGTVDVYNQKITVDVDTNLLVTNWQEE